MEGNDNEFGPRLAGSFDLTLLFEQSVLSIAPSSLFILAASLRIAVLHRRSIYVRHGGLFWLKLVSIAVLCCTQLALVLLWAVKPTGGVRPKTALPASVVSLLASLVFALLSQAEHTRTVRPSFLASGYLTLTILLDVAQARSLWLRPGLGSIAAMFTVALAVKVVMLVLEESSKASLLLQRVRGDGGEEHDEEVKYVALPAETTSGLFSRSLFWWLNSLLYQGFRTVIGMGDLGAIDEKFASDRVLRKAARTWDAANKRGKHALLWAMFAAFKSQFFAAVVPRLCFTGFLFAQPFLINRIIIFVGTPTDERSNSVAGGLIGATILVYVGIAITRAVYHHLTYQLLTLFRGALVSLIFRKTLHVDTTALTDSASVTLMSTDIDYICQVFQNLHELWANVIEIGIAMYLLWRQVGAPCFFVAIPAIIASVATQLVAANMGPARITWSKGVQKRIHITSFLLDQIKGMKMMGLSELMKDKIQELRVGELNLSKKYRALVSWINLMGNLSTAFTPVVVIGGAIFWTLGTTTPLTVAQAFTALSIIYLVNFPLVQLIASYPLMLAAVACFDRIQAYLMLQGQEEHLRIESPSRNSICKSPIIQQESLVAKEPATFDGLNIEVADSPSQSRTRTVSKPIVEIRNGTFAVKDATVLTAITLSVQPDSFSIVFGRVGCGKSSLLKAILGELHTTSGSVRMLDYGEGMGGVAYCGQTPWLRNISVRDNIVGTAGERFFDEKWYETVVDACELRPDIATFPSGDRSLVGSGGVSLSGGQKQRVALARAVYSRRRLMLLDDVFAGLDNTTATSVFNRLLGSGGLLRRAGTTVLLATSNGQFVYSADFVTVLEDGRVLHNQVSPDRLDRALIGSIERTSSSSAAGDVGLGEGGSGGPSSAGGPAGSPAQQDDSQLDLKRATGDVSLYKFYFKSIGWVFSLSYIALAIIWQVLEKFGGVWIRIWTEAGTNNHTVAYFSGFLGLALACGVVGGFTIWFYLVVVVPKSSQHLHYLLLETLLKAPLYFFATTDSGITLNRFSQDMALVDQALPLSFLSTSLEALGVLAETALIASGGTYVAAVIPLCMLGFYVLQKFYLRTSRQMRFLDLEAKSPLYTQFTESLSGIVTIRAFGWQTAYLRENHGLLDASQRPFYLLYCIQRWLNLVLDLIVAGLALVLVAMAVQLRGATTRGAIGLAMVTLINFNMTLSHLINSWTTLETSLGAIARIKNFIADTAHEDQPGENQTPPPGWPLRGEIGLKDVTATYRLGTEPVLRGVSLKILPGQKIGVCGRSGSGKSSLILTILRLLELESGSIFVDGLDVSTLPRQMVRAAFATLPQDPVRFEGTVRENLDPLGERRRQHQRRRHRHANDAGNDDEALVEMLTKVGIWDVVSAQGGLDASFEDLGLSHGQQQLFALARALLRLRQPPVSGSGEGGHVSARSHSAPKMLLLDEATSSLDMDTERAVRQVLREELGEEVTVVEVAHKLEALVDTDGVGGCDIVVVMHEGRIIETGAPRELLGKEGSAFRDLWEGRGRLKR